MTCTLLHDRRSYLFCILCAIDRFASAYLQIVRHLPHITSQTLQINVAIPSDFRAFLTVSLNILLLLGFPLESNPCVCVKKKKKKSTQMALLDSAGSVAGDFGHLGGVMASLPCQSVPGKTFNTII